MRIEPEDSNGKSLRNIFKFKSKAKEVSDKYVSIFEARRIRGWWPCIAESPDGSEEMAVRLFLIFK